MKNKISIIKVILINKSITEFQLFILHIFFHILIYIYDINYLYIAKINRQQYT